MITDRQHSIAELEGVMGSGDQVHSVAWVPDEETPDPEWRADPDHPYQVMRPLTEDEYEALKASIREHGVSQPIEVDSDGNILDGHNRFAICAELQIPCPIKVVTHLKTDQEKRDYARQMNCAKRSPGLAEKKRIAEQILLEDSTRTNHAVAKLVGISPHTVKAVRIGMGLQDANVSDETEATEEEEEKPKFPFLEALDWKLWNKMEALDFLGKLGEVEHRILNELLGQWHCSPADAIQMIARVVRFGEPDRQRLQGLWDSEEQRQRRRSLVRSKLAGTEPVPDRRLTLLMEAARSVREAIQASPGSEKSGRLKKQADDIEAVMNEIKREQEVW